MALRNRKPVDEKILDVDASMQGTLSFRDPVNLRINGKFDGTLETKGNLTISRTAEVNANIIGETIIIGGRVTGDIIARDKLVLLSPAVLKGNVVISRLSVEEGAIFEGNCRMSEDVMDADELAKYLEIDASSILEWVSSGKIPAFKEGDNWRFDRKQIDEWIASGKVM